METKRFVVLANSVKHAPGRCIAGREVVLGPQGQVKFGSWIRPVSRFREGAVYPDQFRLNNGAFPNLFDVVEVDLESRCTDPTQPENWLIQEGRPWRWMRTVGANVARGAAETPCDLWLACGSPTDRAPDPAILQSPPGQSLYWLLLPQATAMRDSYKRHQFRLAFDYGGNRYHLKVTDPEATTRLEAAINGAGVVSVANAMACVSLALPFKGDRYKLIAALVW
jgi:hypothetical protein